MENRAGECSPMLGCRGKPQLGETEESHEKFLEIPRNMWMRKHGKVLDFLQSAGIRTEI